MGDVVVEESSHPFQASFHPCFQRAAPCHRAWLEELLLIMAAGERQMYALEVSRKAAGRSSLIKAERWRRLWGSGRPLPWPFGAVSVSAIIALRRFVPSSFFFPSVIPFRVSLLYCLAASLRGAPFCLHVIRILCLHLFFVKLKTSMPCDTPLWAPLAQLPSSASSSSVCRLPCLATGQLGKFLVLKTKPRQSTVSSIWPHIGTTSGGGIRSVSSKVSSIELIFEFPRSRWA